MTRMLRIVLAFALIMGLSANQVTAQSSKFLSIAAGATMPSGDYGEYAKTGWMGGVGVGTSVGAGNMFVMANAFMGKNSHDGEGAGSTTLTGAGANLGISSAGEAMRFYGYAGAGIMQHKYTPDGGGSCEECSNSKPFLNGAVGVSFGSGKNRYFAQAGMMTRISEEEGDGTTKFMSLMAGIRIGF